LRLESGMRSEGTRTALPAAFPRVSGLHRDAPFDLLSARKRQLAVHRHLRNSCDDRRRRFGVNDASTRMLTDARSRAIVGRLLSHPHAEHCSIERLSP
jgi:hypothetical protein